MYPKGAANGRDRRVPHRRFRANIQSVRKLTSCWVVPQKMLDVTIDLGLSQLHP